MDGNLNRADELRDSGFLIVAAGRQMQSRVLGEHRCREKQGKCEQTHSPIDGLKW